MPQHMGRRAVQRRQRAGPQHGQYTFDEGEQGQPAFNFVRVGNEVAFSIVESVLSGGGTDNEWQSVRFSYEELRSTVASFLDELRDELRRHAPNAWERWWPIEAFVRPSGGGR